VLAHRSVHVRIQLKARLVAAIHAQRVGYLDYKIHFVLLLCIFVGINEGSLIRFIEIWSPNLVKPSVHAQGLARRGHGILLAH